MKIYRLLSLLLLSVLWVFVDSCQPQPEPSAQSARTDAGARNGSPTGAGPYTLTFVGVTYANGQSTFTYQVQRTGPAQGNGLSHLIFGTGCATRAAGGTIDGRAANLVYSEGNGTGCQVSGNFVKFDNVANGVSDGNVHTFTLTLAGLVAVSATDGVWVKAGNACYQSTIAGPGCGAPETYDLGGQMEIRYCTVINDQKSAYTSSDNVLHPAGSLNGQRGSYGIHIAGITVNLFRSDNMNTPFKTTTTNGEGFYTFTNLPAGTYKVIVDSDHLPTGCNPAASKLIKVVDDMIAMHVPNSMLQIPSTNYTAFRNSVNFWLDTYLPNECSTLEIQPDWTYTRAGVDPYFCP
ncbi:MAG: hypothetical protein JWP57_965 [Spirosoma sp.]|nr:hypothetical protein [Spirosoma sp.]